VRPNSARGEELMKDHVPDDRVHPIAEVDNDNTRFVVIVGHAEHIDRLLDVKKPKRSKQH
jgi:hypothetical protein